MSLSDYMCFSPHLMQTEVMHTIKCTASTLLATGGSLLQANVPPVERLPGQRGPRPGTPLQPGLLP